MADSDHGVHSENGQLRDADALLRKAVTRSGRGRPMTCPLSRDAVDF